MPARPAQSGARPGSGPTPDVPERLHAAIDRLTGDAWKLEPGAQAGSVPGLGFGRNLLALDGSASSLHAQAWARELARVLGAEVRVVGVAEPPGMAEHYLNFLGMLGAPAVQSDLAKDEELRVQRVVEDAARDLQAAGITAKGEVVQGRAVEGIVRAADRMHADLVVLGSHGHGPLGRALLGSVADGVKNHVHASVLIAKGAPPPERLLVPTDGSRASKRAASLALELGRAWAAPATVLHVFDPLLYGPLPEVKRSHGPVFEDLERAWSQPQAKAELDFGSPAARILEAAQAWRAGLIVMGSRGLSGLRSLTAGGVSNRVAHQAPCSVLLVKEGRA